MQSNRYLRWLPVLTAAVLWLAAGAELPAGDASAGFQPLTPLSPAAGIEVDLRLPLGGDFRSGCRLPLIARIKTATDRRLRVAVVPELWQIEQQTAALGSGEIPLLDFQSVSGGSWTEPIVGNAVTGAGAAGLVAPLMPVIDDLRRHLVVVELQGGDRYGRVIFRADLAPLLHELLTDERLVIQVLPQTAGAGQPAGMQAATAFPPIPATVRLPDGSSVTPRLTTATAADLPAEPAGWGSIDFLLVPDSCFDRGWNAAQQDACDRYLIAGGQALVLAESSTRPLTCLTRWWNWLNPRPANQPPLTWTLADQLSSPGREPAEVAQFPWIETAVGFGRATVTWLPPEIAEGADSLSPVAGVWRVRWTEILAEQLAARDPRLQPRQRVDQDAYVTVFDPQVVLLPQRLIAQVWWVWAAVVALFLMIGGYALRRKAAPPTAMPVGPAGSAAGGVGRWSLAAGSCVVVAGLASLYATRARVSAIEWRLRLVAPDNSEVQQSWTYLMAWRSVGGLQLTPALAQDRTDAVPLVAGLRDFQNESGRLPAAPLTRLTSAGSIAAVTLDSTRPQLLRSSVVKVSSGPALPPCDDGLTDYASDAMQVPGLPPQLSGAVFELLPWQGFDWAVVLEGVPATASPARLPTDFTGWSITRHWIDRTERVASGWEASPLWIQGAQLNLPPELHDQEDIYKPATLKWLFTQIRAVTRAPVVVVFQRRAFTDCHWQAGYGEPAPVVLDDGLLITVYALDEPAK